LAEVFRNKWLGRRDSNPDTQIQSPSDGAADQQNQGVTEEEVEGVRQKTQCSRNTESPGDHGFGREEDTLP